jgi:hypothetical protein
MKTYIAEEVARQDIVELGQETEDVTAFGHLPPEESFSLPSTAVVSEKRLETCL